MIYIVTALHCEAKPLIDHFDLKKDPVSKKFDVFTNDRIALIVGGIGKIRSAIATTFLLTSRDVSNISVVLNIGICGSVREDRKIGELLYIHSITDRAAGRHYYPETIIDFGLNEGTLETFDIPVEKSKLPMVAFDLVDMEASGFFQAASLFVEIHRICCFKIVSDFLELSHISKDFISALVTDKIPDIERVFSMLSRFHDPDSDWLQTDETELIQKIGTKLRLTQVQRDQLANMYRSAKVRKKGIKEELIPFTAIEIKTKNENKDAFNRIRRILSS